jgi:hypothetical protein
VEESFEHDNERCGSLKDRESLRKLSDYQLFKKGFIDLVAPVNMIKHLFFPLLCNSSKRRLVAEIKTWVVENWP